MTSQLLNNITPYEGRQQLIKRRQYTDDIIRGILSNHKDSAYDYDQICNQFWIGNPEATAKFLFAYCKKNMRYQEEPELMQTVKTPAAILVEGETIGNDCKHYASFIVGICEAQRRCGHPIGAFYRFASDDERDSNPGHVFAVITSGRHQWWCDPVLNSFDTRAHKFYSFVDKKPAPMKSTITGLYKVSGVPNEDFVSGISNSDRMAGTRHIHWLDMIDIKRQQAHHHDYEHLTELYGTSLGAKKKKHPLKLHIKVPHIKIKPIHIKIPHLKIQPGKLLLKIGGAPSRNAFLLLLKLNTFDMAVQFHNKTLNNPAAWNKLAAEWKKVGGNPNNLKKDIEQGVRNYNNHHKAHHVAGLDDGMYDFRDHSTMGVVGVDDGAAAGVLAAAAPIIAALKSVLKSFGINTDKAQKAASDDTANLVAKHNKSKNGKHDDGTETEAGIDPNTGDQTLAVTNVPGPESDSGAMGPQQPSGGGHHASDTDAGAGDDDGGAADDSGAADPGTAMVKSGSHATLIEGGGIKDILGKIEDFAQEHKTPLIIAGAAIVAIPVIRMLTDHRPKRRK